MQTQIELTRDGTISDQMQAAAADANIDAEIIRRREARGQIVIPNTPFRQSQKVVGIARGRKTRVNASIGTSSETAISTCGDNDNDNDYGYDNSLSIEGILSIDC